MIVHVNQEDGNPVAYDFDPKHFSTDDEEIDLELCNIGKLLLNYGEIEAALRFEVGKGEANLERVGALVDADIRNKATEKLTEPKIKNKVVLSEPYKAAKESVNISRRNHAMARWAMVALQQKSECLRALAYRDRALGRADAHGGA